MRSKMTTRIISTAGLIDDKDYVIGILDQEDHSAEDQQLSLNFRRLCETNSHEVKEEGESNDHFSRQMFREARSMSLVSARLRDDKEVVKMAVHQDGFQLRYASERLKDNKKVVVRAISKDWPAIQYSSPRLRSNHYCVQLAKRCARHEASLRNGNHGLANKPSRNPMNGDAVIPANQCDDKEMMKLLLRISEDNPVEALIHASPRLFHSLWPTLNLTYENLGRLLKHGPITDQNFIVSVLRECREKYGCEREVDLWDYPLRATWKRRLTTLATAVKSVFGDNGRVFRISTNSPDWEILLTTMNILENTPLVNIHELEQLWLMKQVYTGCQSWAGISNIHSLIIEFSGINKKIEVYRRVALYREAIRAWAHANNQLPRPRPPAVDLTLTWYRPWPLPP